MHSCVDWRYSGAINHGADMNIIEEVFLKSWWY